MISPSVFVTAGPPAFQHQATYWSSGSYDTSADGDDNDEDGICDAGDGDDAKGRIIKRKYRW